MTCIYNYLTCLTILFMMMLHACEPTPCKTKSKVNDDDNDFHMLQLNAIKRRSWVVKCDDEDDTQN